MKKISMFIWVSAMFFAVACNSKTNKPVDRQGTESTDQIELADAKYTCSMHPEVLSEQPGDCPQCGMALVEIDSVSVPAGDAM
jgi:hypothetical protein